ncbi:MAG: phosphoserine phosphatase SerB [Sphingomonadaceae bacterium]|nr:phosphoserine phosphatase SerB [Sphingomonadaceae bacterium]
MNVVTLTHPAGLPSSAIAAARDALPGGEARWLDEPHAIDLLTDEPLAAVRAALRPVEAQADVFVQPVAGRARLLLVADMDSTMIGQECLDEFADYAGLKAEIAAITARAMAGELDFAGALRERIALLAGVETALVERCLAERIRPAPGAATLIATARAEGIRTVLVTGGFTDFAAAVAAALGFDAVRANRWEVQRGRLTGRVLDPILGADAKRAELIAEAGALGLEPTDAVALGDGANDVRMFEASGLGIAVHGKPAAQAAAHARLNHGDLTSVLWALGIARARWVNRT